MYILFGSYGKQFLKIDKIPNSNKFLSPFFFSRGESDGETDREMDWEKN